MTSYRKLAYSLIVIGMSLFMFERFGLAGLRSSYPQMHIDGTLLGFFVVAPILLVVAGGMVFMIGRARGTK